MKCPICGSSYIDDGTPHGSTYDFVCMDCGHKFDMEHDEEEEETDNG